MSAPGYVMTPAELREWRRLNALANEICRRSCAGLVDLERAEAGLLAADRLHGRGKRPKRGPARRGWDIADALIGPPESEVERD